MLIPRSAILTASILRGVYGDDAHARDYLTLAMDDLKWVYDRRRIDWLDAPKPSENDHGLLTIDEMERHKLEGRIASWAATTQRAAAGDVFNDDDFSVVQAAVRQYGITFGPQRPADVAKVMQPLVDRYAATPIATEAQRHIALAATRISPP